LDNLPVIYTAALLKDIGKVILSEYVGDAIGDIQEKVIQEGLSFIEAEKACLGVDHAAIGGMIARQWHFTPKMTFMIENHHLTVPEARQDPPTTMLYLADMVAMAEGTGAGVDRSPDPVPEDRFKDLGLSEEEVRVLMLMYQGYLRGAETFFEAQ
jgi:HD-like signal output (HDOD) protein